MGKQWYAKDGFKIAAGIACILLFAGILAALYSMDASAPAPAASGEVQIVRMDVLPASYSPSQITVEANRPVQWIIDGSGSAGCTQYLVAPKFGISKRLQKGENVIEFTPTEKGTFAFSCSMNMARGTITVV
jgi:plastocyanin domain-containing protein